MKIFHVNHSDISGGAARAVYRIHKSLREHGLSSKLLVNFNISDDWTVVGPSAKRQLYGNKARKLLGRLLPGTLKTRNANLHSPSVLPSTWPRRLNNSDADVLNLHWVNEEMLSIADIGKIHKPVVWTLHDMWAFCGAEHYTQDFRWKSRYTSGNRPAYESGFDLNKWTWNRKLKHWHRPMHIVTPSRWLADCARQSTLMREWPITVVPNTIDTHLWKPVDKAIARQLLLLPPDIPLVLFGALGGTKNSIKGFDLLRDAISHLRDTTQKMELVVFGQQTPKTQLDLGFNISYTGHLHDDISLSLLYSAADVMVVPSRQEAFGQTASEAHACGTPVVAFDACGLKDIVKHKQTGYLAKPFDSEDLAQGIKWVLENDENLLRLRKSARLRAEQKWSYDIVASQYIDVYNRVLT